jgi:hypothetical protein
MPQISLPWKIEWLIMDSGVVNPSKNAGNGTAKTPRSQRGKKPLKF